MSQATAALVVNDDRLGRMLCRIAGANGYHCRLQPPRLGLESLDKDSRPDLVVLALVKDDDYMAKLLDRIYRSWGDRRLLLLACAGPDSVACLDHALALGFTDIHPVRLPSGLERLQRLFARASPPGVRSPAHRDPQHPHTEE